MAKYFTDELHDNLNGVLEYNVFGKTLYEHLSDGMTAKLTHMPDDSREKLADTLGKIINEGASGLICSVI